MIETPTWADPSWRQPATGERSDAQVRSEGGVDGFTELSSDTDMEIAHLHLDRPLRVQFVLTSMPVGGAETLVASLVERMNPVAFAPELVCLKELGPLGERLAKRVPAHWGLLRHKYDLRVLPRLMRAVRGADAVITVGAGDKMFWGRIAAHLTHVPVVLAALHSTGWPDGVGRLNRLLTGWTDGFIAVAAQHGRFLVEHEKFPADKVHVIPNGVDTKRFAFCPEAPAKLRRELGVPDDTPLCGIVAALRAEKNHRLFLQVAAAVHRQLPKVHFVIVGDGPQRAAIQADVARLQLDGVVHLLGTRNDVPQILSALNVFLLTSDNEANPVSILEALSVQVPVVAPNVGSIRETVQDGVTGFLVPPSEAEPMVRRVLQVLGDPALARNLGAAGRRLVERDWSLERMVSGYERLIVDLYRRRQGPPGRVQRAADRATSGRLATAVAPGQA